MYINERLNYTPSNNNWRSASDSGSRRSDGTSISFLTYEEYDPDDEIISNQSESSSPSSSNSEIIADSVGCELTIIPAWLATMPLPQDFC